MPAFFRMLQSGLLDEPLFSIWLSPDPTNEPAGKLLFGGHNPKRYRGDLQDLPVTSRKCAPSYLQQSSILMMTGSHIPSL